MVPEFTVELVHIGRSTTSEVASTPSPPVPTHRRAPPNIAPPTKSRQIRGIQVTGLQRALQLLPIVSQAELTHSLSNTGNTAAMCRYVAELAMTPANTTHKRRTHCDYYRDYVAVANGHITRCNRTKIVFQ